MPLISDKEELSLRPATLGVPDAGCTAGAARAIPELLAPAGDWDCARAAVENGADAIYFGLERFNARMRAHNFTEADLPKLMQFLHQRGVKGYVTLNTLVFQNELFEAEQCLRALICAGVDAVIVQDIGICRLIRQLSPDFPIHASTQMTITSRAGVAFARDLGCHLVVLARECSLKEIETIQNFEAPTADSLANCAARSPLESSGTGESGAEETRPTDVTDSVDKLPLEVFVHGALCVAYSGQCLTSESLGGRSANRGECAQACRMPYDLISDGRKLELGDRRYLLSPQDLAGLEVLPELLRVGVSSLKIEGRLKSAEYVANITRIYRTALDGLRAAGVVPSRARSEDSIATSKVPSEISASPMAYDMEMAFSRGLSTGWFKGINNQKLVHARFGKKRGVFLGKILAVENDQVSIRLEAPLKAGDGVVFDAGAPDFPEQGGRVYHIVQEKDCTRLAFGRGDLDFRKIHIGDRLWKTSDPELERRLRQSFAGNQPRFQRPVLLEVHGRVGSKLTVIARDEVGHVVKTESVIPLASAESQPLTTKRLREQLGRLGGTPFRLGELQNRLEGETILPISELNRLRREWVEELGSLRQQPRRWTLSSHLPKKSDPAVIERAPAPTSQAPPELSVLVRSLPQLEAALQTRVGRFYCDLDNPKHYRDAVDLFRRWQTRMLSPLHASTLFVAPPRIFKAGEDWILKQVRSCEADGYLVRNFDHLRFFTGCRCVGDYSLNVANSLAADYLKTRYSLERITASYDLNNVQLEALLKATTPDWLEITIHQHMPMFHMEHCVFCAFLSRGTDYTNCGRPCDQHELLLQDRVGARHPVRADAGCRNTVFNSLAQTGAESLTSLIELGARHFRIEFLNESPEVVQRTVGQYRKLLAGELSGAQLWRELKLLNQLGVTRGQADRSESSGVTK